MLNRPYLQYKHARRYMEFLETTFFNVNYDYKQFRRERQVNDFLIKKSFYEKPCMIPYKKK